MTIKSKAFTLAEALIVIVIIGVIAAIALPTVFSHYKKKGFESALKKNYYMLNVALNKYRNDNYHQITAAHGTQIKEKLKPYLNYRDEGGPYSGSMYKLYYNYKGTKHTDVVRYVLDMYGWLDLNDGTSLMFGYTKKKDYDTSNVGVWIDVNGYKASPNMAGVDLYGFVFDQQGKLTPMGAPNTEFYSGEYCDEKNLTCQ